MPRTVTKSPSAPGKLRSAAIAAALLLVAAGPHTHAQPSSLRPFGTLQEQAEMQQAWLKKRLETFLPALMRAHGVDMWVVPMREYNEDPIFPAVASPETFAARRRTIYVFFDSCAAARVVRRAHRARRHVSGRRVPGEALDEAGGRQRRAGRAGRAVGRRAVA